LHIEEQNKVINFIFFIKEDIRIVESWNNV